MKELTWRILVAVWIGAGLATSCSSKPDTKTAQELAQKAPGSKEVMDALDKKDYEGAVGKLLAAQQLVATKEQQDQFTSLTEEVKTRLIEAAPDDPKAAAALNSLRAFTSGR
jgi:hypothetical protein